MVRDLGEDADGKSIAARKKGPRADGGATVRQDAGGPQERLQRQTKKAAEDHEKLAHHALWIISASS